MRENKPINKVMREVGHKFGLVHDFVVVCNGMLNVSRSYSESVSLTTMEMRTIMEVAVHPGITATDLCAKWNRTRGAVSQLLKKIEAKGFIYREKNGGNEKTVLLYPTDEGVRLKNRVTLREFNDSTNILQKLMEMGCSVADLRSFYKVVEHYTQLLLDNPDIQWANMVTDSAD